MKKLVLFFIISSLIMLSGCVYYNTFYNARKYYAEALYAKEQNGGVVSPSIDTKFETSIGKCAYIIQEYPTNKWVDDAILLMGQCYYEQESYIKALRKFNEYEKYYNNQKLYPTAKLYLAKTYLAMKEFDEAMKQFSAIFLNPIFKEVRTDAYFDLTYYYIEKGNYKNARSTILDLLNTDLKKKSHLQAMSLYAQIVFISGEYQNAELAFRNFLAEKPVKRDRLDALMYIGKIYIALGNYKDALQVFENLNITEMDYEKLPEIRMYIALCEAHLGKTEKAFKMFETLIKDNSGKKIISEINYYWGDIYFSVIHDDSLAIEKFNGVIVKNLDDVLVKDTNNKLKIAQERLSFETVQNSNQISQIVEFQFKLAEYYNFDLNQPDSAIAMYDGILDRGPLLHQELDTLSALLLTYPEPDTILPSIDSLEITTDSLATLFDSLEVFIDSLLVRDSLNINTEIQPQGTDSTESASLDFILTEDDSASFMLPDTTFIDSLREFTFIDTAIIDSALVDTMMTDSAAVLGERVVLTRDQLLIKIENLHNMINEFETEIIPKVLFMKLWTYKEKYYDQDMASEMYDRLELEYPVSKYTIAGKKLLNNQSYELIEPNENFAQLHIENALDFFFGEVSLEQSHAYLDTVLALYDSTDAYPQALYLKSYLYVKENRDTTAARPYLEELFDHYPDHELKNEVSDFFDGKHFITYEFVKDSVMVIDSTTVFPDSLAIPDSLPMTEDSTAVVDTIETKTEPINILDLPKNENSVGGF